MKTTTERIAALWRSPWLTLLLLGLSLSLNVYFAAERGHPVAIAQPKVSVGMKMPVLGVRAIDGRPSTVTWDDPHDPCPTVLYVFSPTCIWCTRNFPNIRVLSAAGASSHRFIGLSIIGDGVPAYLAEKPLGFPVYINSGSPGDKPFRLDTTPQTLVIARDGTVKANWLGAYTANSKTNIESWFNVRLPGASAEAGAL